MGKLPFGHDSACSTEKFVPQAHVVGVCNGCQPYLRAMASLKVLLWRVKPNSSRGRDVSQLEAPFFVPSPLHFEVNSSLDACYSGRVFGI